MLPNVREDVGAVGVHFGDRFFQFVPAQQVEGESPDGYGAEAVLEASASRGTSSGVNGASPPSASDTSVRSRARAPTPTSQPSSAPPRTASTTAWRRSVARRSRDPSSSHSGVSTLAASVARPSSTPPRATPRVSRSAAVLIAPYRASAEIARRSALSWVSRWTSPPSPTSSRLSAISSRVSDARSRHRLTTPFTPSRASHRVSPPQTVKHPTDEKRKKCKSTRHMTRARLALALAPLRASPLRAPRLHRAHRASSDDVDVPPRVGDVVRVECASVTTTGEGVCRLPDGRVFLCRGATPGNASRRR